MENLSQNKLKVNRLANRQSDSIRIASNSFRFSAKYVSNRLYIVRFKVPDLPSEKNTKQHPRPGAATSNFGVASTVTLRCSGRAQQAAPLRNLDPAPAQNHMAKNIGEILRPMVRDSE
jgi:hypothetical protein